MEYEIEPEYPGQGLEITARIRAVNRSYRGLIQQILREAAEAGRKTAEIEAPRGEFGQHQGRRISDSIQVSEINYAPGGAGGGGFYEVHLYADSAIAPHLRYVFEGTAGEGVGRIYPAHGNVFAIQKEGEATRFRPWVHGQRPQTAWWEHAHEAVESEIAFAVRGMNIGNL